MKKMVCYVDGSWKPSYPTKVGSAVIIVEDDKVEELSFCKVDEELAKQRNIGGELRASMVAIKTAIDRGYDKVQIFYDYEGIEKWCIGVWRCKNKYTKAYKEFCQEMMKYIDIEFVKVDAHTGDKYNEMADYWAKKSLEE
jgi:ribonuclease HI